ncbi:MAG TPA: hypothetical protein VK892_16955 [Pyrinomonadaceae bacterium]|nr:hypothetical protein [Pyrinomonadaceae bacterium]
MNSVKAYEEVVNFIAAGTTPQNVAEFKASKETKERVEDLIFREKNEGISAEEKAELDLYMQIEHLMRLAKAKARSYLK